MSVDDEVSYGQSTLTDEKLPEVGDSASACKNTLSSEDVVLAKETLNCPVDMGQMEHTTASEITCFEGVSGKSGGSNKSNDDEKLSKESAEAANADENSEDKLQCDQSENTENADSERQGALITVSKIKGINEIVGDPNGDVKLACEESAFTEKVQSNCQRAPSESNDKGLDAEKEDINSPLGANPDTETIGMEEMRGESSSPLSDRGLSEENGAEKADGSCQKAPQLDLKMTRIEQVVCLSSSGQNSCVDKSQGNQSDNAEHEDNNVQEAFNKVVEIKGTGGHSNGDVNLVCEEGADDDKLESNSQKATSISAEVIANEEIKPGSVGSSQVDENVDIEKAGINDSMATNIVTGINGLEVESNGPEKINFVTGISGIEVESNGAEEISDDRPVYQESRNTEIAESQGQSESDMVIGIKRIEEREDESDGTDKRTDGNSTCEERKCVPSIVTEINGLEGESYGAEKFAIATGITGIEVESNGAEEISDEKPVYQESTNTEKLESQGQSVSDMAMVTEITGIDETEGESDGTGERTDGNSTCEERNCHPNIVTEINGLAGESNGAEKSNIVAEITGIEFESYGAEEVTDVKLVYQEFITTEKAESQGQGVSHIVGEIKGVEETEGESVGTDKRTDGNSTCEESIAVEVANSSSSVHKGEIPCSIDAVASGNESLISSIGAVQSVGNRVFETTCNDEVGRESDGDRVVDDNVMSRRDEVSESLHTDGLGSEGMSCNAEFPQSLSTLDSMLPEVDNYCVSSTKDLSSDNSAVAKNEALNSCADDSQVGPNLVGGVENLEGELTCADNSINSRILCEDSEKSHNSGSDNVGVPSDAKFSIDQSVLADIKLCDAGNPSASSINEVCGDVVCRNTLNEPVRDSKVVCTMAEEFTGKEGSESSVADQTSDGKSLSESEDTEKLLSTNIDERVSCGAICHDQTAWADLELSEAGNASASSSVDVATHDAVTFGNETLSCPIEIDQEPANMSIEMAGPEEKGGGSDGSNDDKLICEACTGEVRGSSDRGNDDKLIREQTGGAKISNNKEALTTLAECSSVDAVAARDMNGSAVRGFYFLIRMPRFDDEKLRERIRVAELNVDEKTQCRDAFRQKIRNKRANCQTHGAEFEAAKTQERDARKQVRMKRADISTLQEVIDKAKNAIAIEEIDSRISNMEHIIGHETLPLKEEKLLIREIKQLNQLRGQISSNIGNQDEVQKALDERDVNEERLRTLKKELENLKLKVSKAETIAMAASRKYEDESRKLKELQTQFKAADDIRQEAYEELRNFKKGFYEKNIHFRTYKDEATLASDYARKRDLEALNHLCVNQVERYMELWNENEEFRMEYIRCNTRSTLRRFGTFDGRTLGPDEEPIVLPSYAEERVNKLVANVEKVNSVSQIPVSQQVKQVVVFKDQRKDDKSMLQAVEGMNQIEKTKEAQKPILKESIMVDEPKEVEHLQTAQDMEAARKEDELRKLEEEARLKEQRRLEEIAKAKEALERKRRNAEKAQQRAELRAQKEEEQRLKEREKRLRKKERKKGVAGESDSNDGDTGLISTILKENVKESEATETTQTTTKKPQKPSQYTKQIKTKSSIPPPLRNRSRRKLQQWIWLILSCVIVIALFFLGNIGFFSNLKPRRGPGY